MATAAQIAVSEYLQTTYRPDREYIGWLATGRLQVASTPIRVDLPALFARLHSQAAPVQS